MDRKSVTISPSTNNLVDTTRLKTTTKSIDVNKSNEDTVVPASNIERRSRFSKRGLVVITGVGRNSLQWLEPVLKPALQSWLETDFTPPLLAEELAENPGR